MTADKPTAKTLRALGVNDARGVAEKFAEVRALFDAQAHQSMDRQNWETLRQSWVGRKSGVLTAIAENWLKPETALKRVVGEELNKFKAHLEKTLEERRMAIESGEEEAARECVDLSLPGVIHPIGSHHLIRADGMNDAGKREVHALTSRFFFARFDGHAALFKGFF